MTEQSDPDAQLTELIEQQRKRSRFIQRFALLTLALNLAGIAAVLLYLAIN